MSEPKFPPMPTFMGKPIDTPELAYQTASAMVSENRRLRDEHRQLRDALEHLQAQAAVVFILPAHPELVDVARERLRDATVNAVKVLDRVERVPSESNSEGEASK